MKLEKSKWQYGRSCLNCKQLPIVNAGGASTTSVPRGKGPRKRRNTLSPALIRRLLMPAIAAALVLALLLPSAAAAKPEDHSDNGKGKVLGVMTRNLYLGADLAPALEAESLSEFVAANGKVLRDVTANDFPTRARGLAQEILTEKPDLVGLQEVALWRTGPPDLTPVLSGQPTATTVRYDYLQELLTQLNKGPDRYEVVVVQNEFDLEAPADENEVAGDGPNPAIANAEINGRLTMRDVILARRGAGVDTRNPQSGNFRVLLPV